MIGGLGFNSLLEPAPNGVKASSMSREGFSQRLGLNLWRRQSNTGIAAGKSSRFWVVEYPGIAVKCICVRADSGTAREMIPSKPRSTCGYYAW